MLHPDFQRRRHQLLSKIVGGTAIFNAAPEAVMHNDVAYNFRQDSAFYYLTGFNETGAVAVFAPHHEEHQYILFVQPKDRAKETWSGYRVGLEAAKEEYGADRVYPIAELDQHLPKYLEKADKLYYHFGLNQSFNSRILRHYQSNIQQYDRRGTGPLCIEDPMTVMNALRLYKSDYELSQLRQAVAIAAEAHNLAIAKRKPGLYEYELQAEMEMIFRQRGAIGPAYPSIVASGHNSCILHYVENNRRMEEGELLLIDAGCSVNYYNSDITRTYPVGDRFTPEQRILYELVLNAQQAAIEKIKPGYPWNEFHDAAVRVVTEGLMELGLIVGEIEEVIKEEKYKPFFMHGTGHWLGLDVHDVGGRKTGDLWHSFSPNQVITAEPGIYIRSDFEPLEGQPMVPDRWLGIGIRIEDDILVTHDGNEVLTAAVPKTIEALERA